MRIGPALQERSGTTIQSSHRTASPTGAEVLIAVGVTLAIAVRYRLSPDIPVGFLVAGALFPVTAVALVRFRGAALLLGLATACAVCGLVLTWVVSDDGFTNDSRAIVLTVRVLGLALGTIALLWARMVLGTRQVIFVYAIGMLGGVALAGIDVGNAWKYSWSIPLTLLVMSLPWVYGRVPVEVVALSLLGITSALNDSRATAAMSLIAAALVMTKGRRRRGEQERRTHWSLVVVRLALVGVGGYYLVQAAVLHGDLGEATRARTLQQIETSGSVLLGGRPEIGATVALLERQPWGYGSGVLADPASILVAKSGMAQLGYDPDNGYVEGYMFGNGFEVHSVLGDLWLAYGPVGMALAVMLLILIVHGMASALGRRAISGAALFLAVRFCWDFAFSPFASAMGTLMLTLAVILPMTGRLRSPSAGPPS